MDPNFRWNDEVGGLRQNDKQDASARAYETEHHPHPPLPLKGRAKARDSRRRHDEENKKTYKFSEA